MSDPETRIPDPASPVISDPRDYYPMVYKREDNLWDWRILSPNHEIVATSGGQGFTERNDAVEALARVRPDLVTEDLIHDR